MPPKRRAESRPEDSQKLSRVKRPATKSAVKAPTSKPLVQEKLAPLRAKRGKVQRPTTENLSLSAPLNTASTARLRVFMFGEGNFGELGLGPSTKQAYRPRLNNHLDPGSVGVVGIAVGSMHAVAFTHDNQILTWGVNDDLALGRDTAWDGGWEDINASPGSEESDLNPFESTPAAVPRMHFSSDVKFVQVAASDSATFVLTADGDVYGWGTFRDSNGNHSFSVDSKGKIIEKQREPTRILALRNIIGLSAGSDYALALDSSGVVFSWGNNEQHQLGRGFHGRRGEASPLVPGTIGIRDIVSIHASTYHAFAINKSGYVWAWGANHLGQTGIARGAGEGGAVVFPPQRVTSLSKKQVRTIQGGNHHSIALTDDGKCLVWGSVSSCQMGLNLKTIAASPGVILDFHGNPRVLVQPTVLPIPQCAFVCAGNDHNIVVTSNSEAYSWGLNVSGQCGQGPDDEIDEEPDDTVCVATPIDSSTIRDQNLSWAGAGAQFSMLACTLGDASDPLANHTH